MSKVKLHFVEIDPKKVRSPGELLGVVDLVGGITPQRLDKCLQRGRVMIAADAPATAEVSEAGQDAEGEDKPKAKKKASRKKKASSKK